MVNQTFGLLFRDFGLYEVQSVWANEVSHKARLIGCRPTLYQETAPLPRRLVFDPQGIDTNHQSW